ncbi:3-keto-5-aminohexanoate cleavage protein [Streptomyces sp. NRRL F-2664]|uniref:3-keto-5-aminohexanoate cleavage protein n=1 Tax=Streptomyces sp. NRRL F-2664 TaxID=1463842 RepID=UPI001F42DB23|nr:3-keto-5-aminohexanoate cleavage protein [Streptomyces sp. NRRL F-2664]
MSVNGSRSAADGPAVPLSPQDLAESALRAVAAGAGEVLVHPRTPCGRESLSPRVVGPVLELLRSAGVGVPLTVPASIAAEPDPAGRLTRVGAWTVLPDRALVHFAEPGAGDLAQALLERGVAVDAVVLLGGPAGPRALERLRGWLVRGPGRGLDGAPGGGGRVRVAAEVAAGTPEARTADAGAGAGAGASTGSGAGAGAGSGVGAGTRAGGAAGAGAALPGGLRGLPPAAVVLFGRDAAAWPALRLAARCGAAARTGVGDVLHLPDGRPARSNAELVSAARALLSLES